MQAVQHQHRHDRGLAERKGCDHDNEQAQQGLGPESPQAGAYVANWGGICCPRCVFLAGQRFPSSTAEKDKAAPRKSNA
jgi:hypothetical protein